MITSMPFINYKIMYASGQFEDLVFEEGVLVIDDINSFGRIKFGLAKDGSYLFVYDSYKQSVSALSGGAEYLTGNLSDIHKITPTKLSMMLLEITEKYKKEVLKYLL